MTATPTASIRAQDWARADGSAQAEQAEAIAAPLDLLLTSAAVGPLRRFAPRSAGGAGKRAQWVNRASNGVCLCNDCHAAVEKDRAFARDVGWLVSRISITRPVDIAIPHILHGVVYLDDDGGVTRA